MSHLFTLGEAAQLCPAKVEKRIFLLIQSIMACPVHAEQCETLSLLLNLHLQAKTLSGLKAALILLFVFYLPVSSPLDGEELPVSQPLFQFRGSPMPSVVRAHAFITLGKTSPAVGICTRYSYFLSIAGPCPFSLSSACFCNTFGT